ncbi:MAG: hypothetical protein IJT49_08545 [Clostridia bacterium]|nr:hypothetical protein [Clostridia bacterium]
MKNVKKYIIVSAVLAFVMIVLAVLMVMYDKGVFDISFITRPEQTTAAQTETEPTTDPTTESTDPDSTDTSETEAEETADQSVFDDLHEMIPAAGADFAGATEDVFDPDTMAIYRLDTLELPAYNVTGDYITRTRYVVSREKVLRSFTERQIAEMRRAADVYMGMLVISDGKSLTFYNGKGDQIFKYTGEEELIFAYERDKNDRPLFILGDEYYYIDPGVRTLIKSDFDKKTDSRGLYYNYPSDFAKDAKKASIRGYETVAQKDENGIGSLYFDSGYVMMRNIKHEQNDEDRKVVEDMEVLVNEDGKEFPLPEGYAAKAYSNQRILVSYKGKYGFYAVKGAWIVDSKYSYATPYYEGLAVVGTTAQKGVIDLEGNFVIPLSYSHISVCSGGIIVCWSMQTGYEVYVKAAK